MDRVSPVAVSLTELMVTVMVIPILEEFEIESS